MPSGTWMPISDSLLVRTASPTRSESTAASTRAIDALSSRAARCDDTPMSDGSSPSDDRAQSGTSRPAAIASHTTRPQRSTSRRSGAVTCAYGAARADCTGSAGTVPSIAA